MLIYPLYRLLTCVLYAEYLELLFIESDTSEHKAISSQSLNGVDTHAAHHFLYLVIPCMNEIYKAFIADVGIKSFYKVGTLCCDTPVALACLTAAAKNHIIEGGYDPVYGARPLKRYLQKYVETLAAKMILGGKVGQDDTIVLDVTDGELTASVQSV